MHLVYERANYSTITHGVIVITVQFHNRHVLHNKTLQSVREHLVETGCLEETVSDCEHQ